MSTPASTAARLKLHATSLDALGDPSRTAWLTAAKAELDAVDATNDAAFHVGIAEAVGCLLNACKPVSKKKTQAFLRRFLKETIDK